MKHYYTSLCFLVLISFFGSSQDVNISNAAVFEGEPYLAIDPSNQQHLVAAWMGFKFGQALVIKTKYSDDGGVTWSAVNEIPHITGATSSADVSLEYDSNGNLFMCYIDYENQNFTQGDVIVRKSTDNGVSWGNAVSAISMTDCPNKLCIDRPWIAIDNSTGPNNGTLYITSINVNQPTIVVPPYHSYLVVSTDGGASFSSPRFVDTTNYLVGAISQAETSPLVGPDGTFYATYPSYDTGQSPFVHVYLASSTTLGTEINHDNAYTVLIQSVSNPFAKKGSRLLCDYSEPKHLAILLLAQENGDGDVYFMETYDAINWTTPIRINDDASGNGKLQDLMWADFNEDGDLAICWRDRRNGATSGYQTETQIYGVVRHKDSTNFEPNFPISSQQVQHNAVLEGAGNDFMNVTFVGDTIYSIWGDVRTGTVNIFLNKTSVSSGTTSTLTIQNDESLLTIFPNPADDYFKIEQFKEYKKIQLIDASGNSVLKIETDTIGTADIPSGMYFVRFSVNNKTFTAPLVIQH